jgi:hypothetical protein
MGDPPGDIDVGDRFDAVDLYLRDGEIVAVRLDREPS